MIFPMCSTVVSSRISHLKKKQPDHPMVPNIKFGSNSSLMSGREIFSDFSTISTIIMLLICVL